MASTGADRRAVRSSALNATAAIAERCPHHRRLQITPAGFRRPRRCRRLVGVRLQRVRAHRADERVLQLAGRLIAVVRVVCRGAFDDLHHRLGELRPEITKPRPRTAGVRGS